MSKNKLYRISDSHVSYSQRGRFFGTPIYDAYVSDRELYRNLSNDMLWWETVFPEQNQFTDRSTKLWFLWTNNKFKKKR